MSFSRFFIRHFETLAVYDIGKLKDLTLLSVMVLITMLLANAVLVLITVVSPDWLPRQFFGVEFIADNRQRAQVAAAQYQDGTLAAEQPFVVILGLSSASEGLTLERLSEQIDDGTRFLGLTGGGRNMRDLARYARPLLDSGAKPELAVLAINLFHLMDPPPATDSFLDNLRRRETIDALRGYWLIERRTDIKYAIDSAIDRVRNDVFSLFDLRLHRDVDPWREVLRMGLPQSTVADQWQDNVDRYGKRGYYEAGNYRRSQIQIRVFKDIVTGLQAKGTEVIVVLMPEHSRLRQRIPADAMNLLVAEPEQGYGQVALPIVDMRDSIPDSGFKDISHMNEQGRLMYAPLLADVISRQLTQIR